ncbi:hypothetical protein H181DRAFT_03170 [Streptomyces sp. WMMB 714]|uniref:hypothetical protein n=1 Tax=Streptomyces sp. WMMB 714 TaxID=1286822 RepID=UPI0005F7DDB9|nr:hypothetical protein [Streptomyces sp. WMMB 714]SCK37404.1 hypothetical protein H181DRAFT_03170 [Streptomyces sp. WMMB 714]
MPLTPSPAAGPRRRSMLTGTLSALGPLAALGAATGCTDGADEDDAQAARREQSLRKKAAGQSRALAARYEATIDAHSGLADKLRPLHAVALRHAEVLAGKKDAGRGKDGAAGGGGTEGGDGKGAAVPRKEKAALAALGDAERRTADERNAALAEAPPELARLLASVAAAGAVHAYLLGAGEQDGEDEGA